MKKAVAPKKKKTAADVVAEKKPAKSGPVVLDLDDLKKVAGGCPRAAGTGSRPTGLRATIKRPRGTW